MRMVLRLTLSILAIPCCETRSESARSMAASFSEERARLLGTGVKVFLHERQRHRAVPLRLVPNLITSFLLPQCGHDKATNDRTLQQQRT